MTFAHPWVLAIAVAAAAASWLLFRGATSRGDAGALRYSNLAFLTGAVRARAWPVRVLGASLTLGVLLLVAAFAHPRVRAAVPAGGSVVLCVDTSGSMAATDVTPTRAQAALEALRAFAHAAPSSTAVGIVSFATGAQILTPPTRDRDRLHDALQSIPLPNGATAIGDALAAAQNALPQKGRRVVVLITDGENTYGSDPMQAARALGAAGIPLYTIGIGTNSGALIPGTLETAGINEDALRAYAAAAGGSYSRASDAPELRRALASLGRTVTFERRTVDVAMPAAAAAAALMALTFLGGLAAGRYP